MVQEALMWSNHSLACCMVGMWQEVDWVRGCCAAILSCELWFCLRLFGQMQRCGC